MRKCIGVFFVLLIAFGLNAQEPCENGFAGIYPCLEVDQQGFISIDDMGGSGSFGINDIWGWTDHNSGSEYALVGKDIGLAIVDVTDATAPIYLGTLPTHTDTSLWRDVKVIGNYAYVGSEAPGHGIQIFDLTQLADVTSPPVIFSESAHYDGVGKSHNVVACEESGYLYAVGTNTFAGGPHFINMNSPMEPVIAGGFDAQGYCHDAQVVIYSGPDTDYAGKEVYFGCHGNNAEAFVIVDVTDKSDPTLIKAVEYENHVYSHQGWLTEDHRFFLLCDELDEQNLGYNTRTRIFNVQDLDDPIFMGHFESSLPVIDHNVYTRGNYAFQSNYAGGLRILDLTDIENGNLSEIGYFDVHPANNDVGFSGNWSNYPYFESGNIVVTHRTDGLFIVNPTGIDLSSTIEEIESVFLEIYPNPASESIFIEMTNNEYISFYEIIDVQGKIIKSEIVEPTPKLTVGLESISKGAYFVKVNGGNFATKFIKK